MSEEQQNSDSPKLLRVRRQGQRMTPEEREAAQEIFLAAFREHANLSAACEIAGIHIDTPYDWKNRYKDFAKKFAEAEQAANDAIDLEIYRRGVKGWLEPAISSGKWVHGDDGQPAMIPRYSDAMLTLLAKARMPEKYREKQQIEHSGPDGGPIQTQQLPDLSVLTSEQLSQFKSWLHEAKAKEQE